MDRFTLFISGSHVELAFFAREHREEEAFFASYYGLETSIQGVYLFFFLCCEFFSVVMSLKITCRVTRLNTTLITIKLLQTTYYFMPVFLYQCEHIMAFDIYTAPNAKNSVQ